MPCLSASRSCHGVRGYCCAHFDRKPVGGHEISTGYSADGDIVTELEPGNITRAYSYLTAGQLSAVTSKLGASTSAAVTYTRDLNGRQTKAVSGTSTIVSGYNENASLIWPHFGGVAPV